MLGEGGVFLFDRAANKKKREKTLPITGPAQSFRRERTNTQKKGKKWKRKKHESAVRWACIARRVPSTRPRGGGSDGSVTGLWDWGGCTSVRWGRFAARRRVRDRRPDEPARLLRKSPSSVARRPVRALSRITCVRVRAFCCACVLVLRTRLPIVDHVRFLRRLLIVFFFFFYSIYERL